MLESATEDKITIDTLVFAPRHEKTCLRGFRQSEIQTSFLGYRDQIENCTCRKSRYDTFQ